MFERFTDRARRVVVLAQEEARHLDHDSIGTEHLLLGLLAEDGGMARRALDSLDVHLADVRVEVERVIGRGQPGSTFGHIPFTPRAKKVLELGLRESLQLGQTFIGTEHLLLAILTEGDGVAAQILQERDIARESIRLALLGLGLPVAPLGSPPGAPEEQGFAAGIVREFEETQAAAEGIRIRPIDPGEMPTCPSCRGSLVGSLRVRTVDAQSDAHDGVVAIRLTYCGRCGAALQVLP